jgi:predicted hydrocarbon binding protein
MAAKLINKEFEDTKGAIRIRKSKDRQHKIYGHFEISSIPNLKKKICQSLELNIKELFVA